jgi:hypothetical protein
VNLCTYKRVGKGLPFKVVKMVKIVEGNYIQSLALKDTILDDELDYCPTLLGSILDAAVARIRLSVCKARLSSLICR